ncbi:MAG: hypothetical protein IT377_02935 [Polyangiaceae bacterium]|nr:hypothetical protein [Polyangiaceae bacterium]
MSGEGRVTFRRVRVGLLVAVLAVVLLWAWNDVRRRKARTEWKQTVQVALVLLRRGAVDPASVAELKARTRELEARLAQEMARHRGTSEPVPFAFTVYGPIDVGAPPPRPTGDELGALAKHAWDSWQYFRDVDQRAAVEWRAADSRIYLVLQAPASEGKKTVEGQSEQGGRVGSVEVELDSSMVDFALFVAAHELFHTLGATDKYDALGRARVPDGLPEPDRAPLYPQAAAEIMARNRVVAPGNERPPDTLAELSVGPATAREIGWLSATPP